MDDSKNPSSAPGPVPASPDSASFSTDRLPPSTSSSTTSDEEAAADLEIIREEPLDNADEEGGDGRYQYDDYMDFASENSRNDEDGSDSYDDSYAIDQIMAEKRAARAMDIGYAHGGAATDMNLPLKLHDQDTDDDMDYRRPKRHRADLRPPRASHEVTGGGTSSSQGTSQPGHSRDEVPMTDQTDEEHSAYKDDADDVMHAVQGSLKEWLLKDEVREFIAKKFNDFLLVHIKHREPELINDMIVDNKCSLKIDYKEFIRFDNFIGIWLAEAPRPVLEVMDEAAKNVVFRFHDNYKNIHQQIYVRITDFPCYVQMCNIRRIHLNKFISMGGVVTGRSSVASQLHRVKYNCNKCWNVIGPFFQSSSSEVKVGSCPECQSRGGFTVNIEQTIHRDYQTLTLQESPEIVPVGQLPRCKRVILLNDLVGCARLGEEIEVTGIYTNNLDSSLNVKIGFPVFSPVVEANYVRKHQDLLSVLTEEDKAEIWKLAEDNRIDKRIIKSIAPSIYGHENIKMAIALAMFGGQEKNVKGNLQLRGNINVLLVGEPGTAKSQFLKYVKKNGQRAVYTTGKGSSAAGLSAAVGKDPITGAWTLQCGALVLADKGICLIDEFDNMNDRDRASIHEAMEQQSISISKAGIVTSLKARCSVIAAANPIGGRYDSLQTFSQNVNLTDPVISRFDILCVLKDIADPVTDEMLALFIVDNHYKSQPTGAKLDESISNSQDEVSASAHPEIIPQDLLKKYITYSKLNVFPKLLEAHQEKLIDVYCELRDLSSPYKGNSIVTRHLESMIRMSEAHARMHLRNHVSEEDVDVAIRVLVDSFISTQKFAVQIVLRKRLEKYLTFEEDYNPLLLFLLRTLIRELVNETTEGLTHIEVQVEELQKKAAEYEIYDLTPFFTGSVFSENFEFDESNRVIRCAWPFTDA